MAHSMVIKIIMIRMLMIKVKCTAKVALHTCTYDVIESLPELRNKW